MHLLRTEGARLLMGCVLNLGSLMPPKGHSRKWTYSGNMIIFIPAYQDMGSTLNFKSALAHP